MDNVNLPAETYLQGGRYKIIRYISSGGFGCTYEALHVKLGKKLAIKEFFVKDFCNRDETTAQVSIGTSSKKGLVKRLSEKFCEEAQALSELNHPGIVKVIDVFDENGTSYFVMDYIDGKSLSEVVRARGALPENLAVQLIRQVADALKYVHSNNRLHLDIKPGNIMLNKEGKAILIDFGASKQYDEVEGENTSTLLGKTPGYAPIEQMGNDVATFHPSTDIYALGGTLYNLLTGKTPMSATRRVSGEEMMPLPEGISEPVRRAVMKSMELNKKYRPQSIDEFLEILGGEDSEPEDYRDVADNDNETIIPGEMRDYYEAADNEQNEEESQPGGKKKLVIAAVAVAVIAIVTGVVFMSGILTKDKAEEADVTVLTEYAVTDSTIVIDENTTMIYTGLVDIEGLPNGNGHSLYKSNNYEGEYEGEYKDGKRSGHGHYVYKGKDGRHTFEGIFDGDKYKEGTLVDAGSGSYYVGTFSDGNPYDGTTFDKSGNQTGVLVKGKMK